MEGYLFVFPLFIISIAGLVLKVFPPKKRNYIYGYRTKRAMKSQETWDFAQQYSGNLMFIWGIASALGMSLKRFLSNQSSNSDLDLITGAVFLFVLLLGIIWSTEQELKKRYTDD